MMVDFRKVTAPTNMLVQFYMTIIESICNSSIKVLYSDTTARDRHTLNSTQQYL